MKGLLLQHKGVEVSSSSVSRAIQRVSGGGKRDRGLKSRRLGEGRRLREAGIETTDGGGGDGGDVDGTRMQGVDDGVDGEVEQQQHSGLADEGGVGGGGEESSAAPKKKPKVKQKRGKSRTGVLEQSVDKNVLDPQLEAGGGTTRRTLQKAGESLLLFGRPHPPIDFS